MDDALIEDPFGWAGLGLDDPEPPLPPPQPLRPAPEDVWENPAKYFPHYPRGTLDPEKAVKVTLGEPPCSLGIPADANEPRKAYYAARWTYGHQLFEPLWWYLSKFVFEPADRRGPTMIELAIDFYLATRVQLTRPGHTEDPCIYDQAVMLCAAIKRLLRLSKSDLTQFPFQQPVATLADSQWPRTSGIGCRVQLLQPRHVEAVLIRAYLSQDAHDMSQVAREAHVRKAFAWHPDYRQFKAPLWAPRSQRRRLEGKQPAPYGFTEDLMPGVRA